MALLCQTFAIGKINTALNLGTLDLWGLNKLITQYKGATIFYWTQYYF